MKYYFLLLMLLAFTGALSAQQTPPPKANYRLAARCSPKKQDKLLFSTIVAVHW
jgi:dipeptidyl-peptidase 4